MQETELKQSKWLSRWIGAAIIQGLLATILTGYFVLGQVFLYTPIAFSRIIAGGSAGNWFTVGYLSYITVGVLGVALTGLFYYFLEDVLRKQYTGVLSVFAWIHLVLMNVGVLGATWPMIWGGYWGAASMLPPQQGGQGWNAGQVHENILGPLPVPISIFIGLLTLGVLLGGLGYILVWRKKA